LPAGAVVFTAPRPGDVQGEVLLSSANAHSAANVTGPAACQRACGLTSGCNAWTYCGRAAAAG
jgi:hypothetical protein